MTNGELLLKTQLLRNNIFLLEELSEINPIDMELYEKDKKIIISFIDELFNKKAIKDHNTVEEATFMDIWINQANLTQQTRFKLESVITSNFKKFEENMKQFDFNYSDIMHIYANVLVQEILQAFESFRKYLLLYIDTRQFKLKGTEPLGVMLTQLKNYGINHRFNECVDIDIRNAVAHNSYWFKNDTFYYSKDPTFKRTKSLKIRELGTKMQEIEVLVQAFGNNAQPRILQLRKENEPIVDKEKKV